MLERLTSDVAAIRAAGSSAAAGAGTPAAMFTTDPTRNSTVVIFTKALTGRFKVEVFEHPLQQFEVRNNKYARVDIIELLASQSRRSKAICRTRYR